MPWDWDILYTGGPLGTAYNIAASLGGDDDISGADVRVLGDSADLIRKKYIPDSDLLRNPTAGRDVATVNPTSFRGKTALKAGNDNIVFKAMPGRYNTTLGGTDFMRRKAADSARKTGLVYARSTALDKAVVDSGAVRLRKGVPTQVSAQRKLIDAASAGRSSSLLESVGRASAKAKTLSPVGQLSEAVTNLRIDRALDKAAKDGKTGKEALEYVTSRVPKAAEKVGLPTAKGLPSDKFGMDKGLLQRFDGDELFDAKKAGKAAKAAGSVAKFIPIVGAAADAKELFDELREEDVEIHEVAGAVVDLALGLTGVGGIIGDAVAFGFGADGLGSLFVGDKD